MGNGESTLGRRAAQRRPVVAGRLSEEFVVRRLGFPGANGRLVPPWVSFYVLVSPSSRSPLSSSFILPAWCGTPVSASAIVVRLVAKPNPLIL